VLNIGLADDFIEHGTREECLALAQLDEAGLLAQMQVFLSRLDAAGMTSEQSRKASA